MCLVANFIYSFVCEHVCICVCVCVCVCVCIQGGSGGISHTAEEHSLS